MVLVEPDPNMLGFCGVDGFELPNIPPLSLLAALPNMLVVGLFSDDAPPAPNIDLLSPVVDGV